MRQGKSGDGTKSSGTKIRLLMESVKDKSGHTIAVAVDGPLPYLMLMRVGYTFGGLNSRTMMDPGVRMRMRGPTDHGTTGDVFW